MDVMSYLVPAWTYFSLSVPGEADAYCIIKCEGESVRTPVDKKTCNPKWNTTAIFYRSKPDMPIVIEVRKSPK